VHTCVQYTAAIFFHLGKRCHSPTWTRRIISVFSRIPRASRVLLIPINKPLNIEEKHTSLEKNQRLLQDRMLFPLIFLFSLLFSYEDDFHPNYV